MSLNPAWRTHDAPELLQIESIIFTGGFLGAIAYGAHIAVFLSTLHALWAARDKKRAILSTFFICVLFTFASLNIIRTQLGLKLAFVEYRNFPGGPGAFFPASNALLPASARYGDTAAVMVTWTADAILLWRCYVVWSQRLMVVIVPIMMWVAAVVTGSIVCYEDTLPGNTLRTFGTANYNLAFWALSLSLNMLLSGLILGRLLRARAHAKVVLGSQHTQAYTSIASIIIESAAPYAALAFAWIVMYGLNSLGAFLLLQVLVQIEAIAPELIILRIAHGRAWTADTNQELTTNNGGPIRFATNTGANGSRTSQSTSDAVPMHGLAQSSTVELKGEKSEV